jgi:hypothetical protein
MTPEIECASELDIRTEEFQADVLVIFNRNLLQTVIQLTPIRQRAMKENFHSFRKCFRENVSST